MALSQIIQYSDLVRPDEDWRELEDSSERRKLQNRIAQRVYRRNQRDRADEIEELRKRLKVYEELEVHTTRVEDNISVKKGKTPGTPMERRSSNGDWYTTQQRAPGSAIPSESLFHMTTAEDNNFDRMQQSVFETTVQRQRPASNHLQPANRPQTQFWEASIDPAEPSIETMMPSMNMPVDDRSRHDFASSPRTFAATTFTSFAPNSPELPGPRRQSVSLLHMAIAGNHIDVVKVLLQDDRVVVDAPDNNGLTPLQRAVTEGKSEIVRLLLEHSAPRDFAGRSMSDLSSS